MSPYRILYHHRIRSDDGQAVHVREMIRALQAQGHQVMECALVHKSDPVPSNTQGSVWQHLRLPRFATELGEMAYSRQGKRMLLAAAETFRPDFIYERHALHCRSGMLASQALKVPLLLEVNSPLCDEMAKLKLLRFPRQAMRSEQEVLQYAHWVLPVSDVLAQRLQGLGAPPERIRVIRNGGEPDRYGKEQRAAGNKIRKDLGLHKGDVVAGFIGYMRAWHQLDLVLAAMQRLQDPRLHLFLVGQGPALQGLLTKAMEMGLSKKVHALGSVSAARLPDYCCAFDYALVPAINTYASPLKLFDSLAAGIATVAVDQPNIHEVIEDGSTGLLFPSGDVAALAAQMWRFTEDVEFARSLGKSGRQSLVENDWTWSGAAKRVVAAFEEVNSLEPCQ